MWQQRRTTGRVGNSVVDITEKLSKEHSELKHHQTRIPVNDKKYTDFKVVFRAKASTSALQIEVNQCQLVDGSFSSIPHVSIKNIVPSSSLVFTITSSGSVLDLINLFASGHASIGDHDENGCSLLHVRGNVAQMTRF